MPAAEPALPNRPVMKIATRDERAEFRPGDEIVGAAGWQLPQPPASVEVRLLWYTQGKGLEDVGLVETVRLDHPQREEARPFRFIAPAEPYSFSGKLISLQWAVEVVAQPGDHAARFDLSISPTGKAILLRA